MADGEPIFKTYTLTAGAVALSGATILGTTQSPRRIIVQNASGAANSLYLGGSAVSATDAGREVVAGAEYVFENQDPQEIYIIGTVNAANIAHIIAEF